MNPHSPPPEDPHQVLGDPLWDLLGQAEEPAPAIDFDARFHRRLGQKRPPRRRWLAGTVAAGTLVALAATVLLVIRPPPPPSHDLALVADLEIVEQLDLLSDMDVLLAWDGVAP